MINFDYLKKHFEIVQDEWEFNKLREIVFNINPKTILEIGVERGGSLQAWSDLVGIDGYVLGIDANISNVRMLNFVNSDNITLLEGNSSDVDLINDVDILLKNESNGEIDFLFIDGDHNYDGVKSDFINYINYVRNGGIVAFHDIMMDPSGNLGVTKFWNEIKTEYKNKELHRNIGIGVIWV